VFLSPFAFGSLVDVRGVSRQLAISTIVVVALHYCVLQRVWVLGRICGGFEVGCHACMHHFQGVALVYISNEIASLYRAPDMLSYKGPYLTLLSATSGSNTHARHGAYVLHVPPWVGQFLLVYESLCVFRFFLWPYFVVLCKVP